MINEEIERKNQELKIEKNLGNEMISKKDQEMKFLISILDDLRIKHNDLLKSNTKIITKGEKNKSSDIGNSKPFRNLTQK